MSDRSQPSARFDARRAIEHLLGEATLIELSLWLLVLTALTLDVYLTARGLRYGLAEWNPVMRRAIESVGFPALGLSKAVVLGVGGFIRAARPDLGALVPLAIGVPWSAAVLVNLVMIGLL